MNLYIDTNIFLDFFKMSKGDRTDLENLANLIKNGNIILYLPEQTRDEFYRNREKIISTSIKNLVNQKISSKFPNIFKDYEKEYELLKKTYIEYQKHFEDIISKIKKDTKEYKLNVDTLISQFFSLSNYLKTTDCIMKLAKKRFELGSPPGKGNCYGDAVIWECLLHYVDRDLHLISNDNDFSSPLDEDESNLFMKSEWGIRRKGILFFYRSISKFFKDNYPNIKLPDQVKKESLITNLAYAQNFLSAKSVLAELSNCGDFTSDELNKIAEISVSNNQIYWIRNDFGVGNVLIKIIEGNEDEIEERVLKKFDSIYRPPRSEADNDFPF